MHNFSFKWEESVAEGGFEKGNLKSFFVTKDTLLA